MQIILPRWNVMLQRTGIVLCPKPQHQHSLSLTHTHPCLSRSTFFIEKCVAHFDVKTTTSPDEHISLPTLNKFSQAEATGAFSQNLSPSISTFFLH